MISFTKGNSPIHSMDARLKIIALIAILSVFLLAREPLVAVAGFCLSLALYAAAGIPLSKPFKEGRIVWIGALALVPLHIFFGNGLEMGLASSLLLASVMLTSMLFVFTTETRAFFEALCFFRLPKRIAFMLVITMTFIPVLQREFGKTRVAQAARGHKGMNPFPVLLPYLHKLFSKSEKLALSMESRCFDPEDIHLEKKLKMGLADYAVACFMAASAAALLFLCL